MAILLEGKKIAQDIKLELKDKILQCSQKYSKAPVLSCIAVGENPASAVYIKSQANIAKELGIDYRLVSLPADICEEELIAEVIEVNSDDSVNGIMIAHPLPKGLDKSKILEFVSFGKDVEGIHPENLGRLVLGTAGVAPCTASACMELLRRYQIKLYGKEVVVVGHSEIVGKPLALLLLKEFATTTVCHIATFEAGKLVEHIERADILIAAVGKAGIIKGNWIKEGAVVVDVGINKIADTIVGDVEFEVAQKKASYITPVPGGVGPLTTAMLMRNCFELFKEQNVS